MQELHDTPAPFKRGNAARNAATESPRYTVDIEEGSRPVGTEQSKGRYRAYCRETGTELTSVNAEHDLCHALTVAGWPDGPVRFWRGATPSLSHPSIHRLGRSRIALGEQFPQRIKRRNGHPEISSESMEGFPQNREKRLAHTEAHQ
jgi:hypothetical protein